VIEEEEVAVEAAAEAVAEVPAEVVSEAEEGHESKIN